MEYIVKYGCRYVVQDLKSKVHLTDKREKATRWRKLQSAQNVISTLRTGKAYKDCVFSLERITEEGESLDPTSEKVLQLNDLVIELGARKEQLVSELSKLDLTISDLEHAAEFYNYSASQGYKLYRKMHEVTIARRKCKNELQKIDYAMKTTLNPKGIDWLSSSIHGLENRKYAPRVLNDLFEKKEGGGYGGEETEVPKQG